jgi:hypothetical protein
MYTLLIMPVSNQSTDVHCVVCSRALNSNRHAVGFPSFPGAKSSESCAREAWQCRCVPSIIIISVKRQSQRKIGIHCHSFSLHLLNSHRSDSFLPLLRSKVIPWACLVFCYSKLCFFSQQTYSEIG